VHRQDDPWHSRPTALPVETDNAIVQLMAATSPSRCRAGPGALTCQAVPRGPWPVGTRLPFAGAVSVPTQLSWPGFGGWPADRCWVEANTQGNECFYAAGPFWRPGVPVHVAKERVRM